MGQRPTGATARVASPEFAPELATGERSDGFVDGRVQRIRAKGFEQPAVFEVVAHQVRGPGHPNVDAPSPQFVRQFTQGTRDLVDILAIGITACTGAAAEASASRIRATT